MMNIALPRKKSRRGSRPLFSGSFRPSVASSAIGSASPQPGGNRQERHIALEELDGTAPADRQDDEARQPDRTGFLEQNAAVAIGVDAERREHVEEDRAGHDPKRQRGANDLGSRDKEQDRSDELHRAGDDPHELLMTVKAEPVGQGGEEIDTARVAGEFVLKIVDEDIGDERRQRPGNKTENTIATLAHGNLCSRHSLRRDSLRVQPGLEMPRPYRFDAVRSYIP